MRRSTPVRNAQLPMGPLPPRGASAPTDGPTVQGAGMLLGTVAHELRQPLGLLKMALSLLDQEIDPDAARRARTLMQKQVCVMARLVDDLLDATRLQNGTLTLRRETVDLRTLIAHAVDEQRDAPPFNNTQFIVSLPSTPVLVAADAMRTNAVKYSVRGGRVWVYLTVERDSALLTVKDEGRGIDNQALPHIFDPFVQIESEGRGLGLGLTIARSLVELHGGHITAASDGAGHGAEFRVTLPLLARA
jgi:signal transduction histidine kinase